MKPWENNNETANGKTVQENFASWFGRSKVTHPDGSPMVVYHGSPKAFDAFDYDRIESISEGLGFYFTANEDVARGYGEVMPVYLSLQNPMDYDAKSFSKAQIKKIIRTMAELESASEGKDIADGVLSNFGDVRHEGLESVLRKMVEITATIEGANDQIASFFGSGVNPAYILKAVHQVTGHDGIYSDGFSHCGIGENPIYVAWFPCQIKSATDNAGLFLESSPSMSDHETAIKFEASREDRGRLSTARFMTAR